jgi:hypothetical protein
MKNENRIIAFINGYKIFVQRKEKRAETILTSYSSHAAHKFLPSTAASCLLGDLLVYIHPSKRCNDAQRAASFCLESSNLKVTCKYTM